MAPHKATWECLYHLTPPGSQCFPPCPVPPPPPPPPPIPPPPTPAYGFSLPPTDVKQVEGQIPLLYGDDAFEIAGARSLIDSLIALSAPWAIVTSGTEPLVSGWLSRLSLAVPRHLVTAESVADGKPDPACYRMGLDKLNLAHRAGDVVVLEDAPAGIEAGKAAGCKVIGLVTSHTVDQVVAAGPDWVVKDLESVRVVGQHDGRVTVEISNALRL